MLGIGVIRRERTALGAIGRACFSIHANRSCAVPNRVSARNGVRCRTLLLLLGVGTLATCTGSSPSLGPY